MNVLVIGAGGNRGAAGAGKVAAINSEYEVGVGISTGALMLVPALLGEHKVLKDTYTTIKPKDIFAFNPINKKGHLKVWWLLWRLIAGKRTVADSTPLRDQLSKLYQENDLWSKLKDSGKTAWVGVYNDTQEKMVYISSDTVDLTDWLDYTWASACQPPIMSIVEKNYNQFVDGGVQEMLPLEFAAKLKPSHITVVAHRPKMLPLEHKKPIQNLIHHAARLIIGMRKEIRNGDLKAGMYACRVNKVDYDIHYVGQGYGENSLVFDNIQMSDWYNSANSERLNPEVVRF